MAELQPHSLALTLKLFINSTFPSTIGPVQIFLVTSLLLQCNAFFLHNYQSGSFRYPLEENVQENAAEDQRCLAKVEEILEAQTKIGNPVVGVIVEPIQSEGGDHHGSNVWFQGLQKICAKHDIVYLMDEVQTGGGPTGKLWAHEYFELDGPPDIVTFSKKMLTGGMYNKPELSPKQGYRIFNTWVGDPGKLILLEAVLKTIKKDNLLDNTVKAGEVLLQGLKDAQAKFPGLVHSARGLGTFCAIDADTPARYVFLSSYL